MLTFKQVDGREVKIDLES